MVMICNKVETHLIYIIQSNAVTVLNIISVIVQSFATMVKLLYNGTARSYINPRPTVKESMHAFGCTVCFSNLQYEYAGTKTMAWHL